MNRADQEEDVKPEEVDRCLLPTTALTPLKLSNLDYFS